RAGRQLELVDRERRDGAKLAVYQPRDELDTAFRALLAAGPGEPWVLHFAGAGATGKTLFLAHAVWDLVPPPAAYCARIDFDYLNADYPPVNPGLLPWGF